MVQELVQNINFTNGYVVIKFNRSVRVSSIDNDKFLVEVDSPPESIADPFHTINIDDDYNSISRTLYLYWADSVLSTNTTYNFTITGLLDAAGSIIDDVVYQFSTGESIELSPDDATPTPAEFSIVDYSINTDAFSTVVTTTVDETEYLVVTETDPENGDYYLPASYNNGRVTITFDDAISASNLTTSNFKVQRREISRGPTRWESVTIEFSISDDQTEVYIDFPSTDATPVYYTADTDYFEENYKYRVVILSTIIEEAATPHISMLEDYTLLFSGVLDPLYLNPEELSGLYPDATELELAEYVWAASAEVKAALSLSDDEAPPYIALDYIKAAAACALSKIYDPVTGTENVIQLGDLSVTTKYASRSSASRSSATTWCELAAALRKEMLFTGVGIKATRKANIYPNPIPERKLKRYIDNIYVPPSEPTGNTFN